MAGSITTLAPWYGADRLIARHVGAQLRDADWCGIPFVGGCSAIRHIPARTIVAADQHKHLINLAQALANPYMGSALIRRLRRLAFHEVTLADAQRRCREVEATGAHPLGAGAWAEDYFVCAWMGRSGTAGTPNEFTSGLSVRWDAGGGDSVVRFRSAAEGLRNWRCAFERVTFLVRDCFSFLPEVKDREGHAVYADAPWPDDGHKYTHGPGAAGSDDERAFHVRLRDELERFTKTRVVVRFGDHSLVRELYSADRWTRIELTGRTQTNADKAEVLLVNGEALPVEEVDHG
jgi:hypothetical protein